MSDQPPLLLAFFGTLFGWAMTAGGASLILFGRQPDQRILDGLLGFAAGVMVAASFWSLLAPSIELASAGPLPAYVPAGVGFLAGGAFVWALDKTLPHLHVGAPREAAEGVSTAWRRATLFALAVTLHNFPEGLSVGVGYGSVGSGGATFTEATALALGIGIQNLPEGLAVAVPFRRLGMGRGKAFWYGQLSGIVEVFAGILGAGLVLIMGALLPYALAFAAGAMIYVVFEEVIPEGQRHGHHDIVTVAALIGFTVMMVLDVGLG